jgi:hypothetical protein
VARLTTLGLHGAPVTRALGDFSGKRHIVSGIREYEVDFATGEVQDASFTARPDAIVGRLALAPGPRAPLDLTDGLKAKAWYARYDNDTGKVWLGESADDTRLGWAETELFSYTGDDIDAISLAFDVTGRPHVAMERNGNVWVRYWDGAAYQLDDKGAGTTPTLIHQSPDNPTWGVLYLIFESGSDIRYRVASDDYATNLDTLSDLGANQRLERAILDDLERIHLILSERDAASGRYTLPVRLTSTAGSNPPCIELYGGIIDRIDDGIETVFVYDDDGGFIVACAIAVDILLLGGGGGSGDNTGLPTTLWATVGGVALNPLTDVAPAAHIADGGAIGASLDLDGNVAAGVAHGGGGGGNSPSGNAMRTQGGRGRTSGGGGMSTWGLLDKKEAASGGGGGYGGSGTSGVGGKAGIGGVGGVLPDSWAQAGPGGGRGDYVWVPSGDTEPVMGGGGAGGVRSVTGFIPVPGEDIQVIVGTKMTGPQLDQLSPPGGKPAWGGKSGDALAYGGLVAIRVPTSVLGADGTFSGGVEVSFRGFTYYIFTAGGTLTVVAAGQADVLVVGGGGGGGSGCGGGGGGGGVRLARVEIASLSEAIEVGAGGAGGVAGAVGADGVQSAIGAHVVALGGGGGAGTGTPAGSGATGGGGHGVNGDPGDGAALRGLPGGDGKGFSLSVGGFSEAAGGGGGVGGEGDQGADRETTGDELTDHWEEPAKGSLDVANQHYRFTLGGSEQAALIGKDVAVEPMMVQGLITTAHSSLATGIIGRGRHPTGDPDENPTGYFSTFGNNLFRTSAGNAAYFHGLSSWHHVQLYAEDDLQEYSITPVVVTAPPYDIVRMSDTDATENGNVRSFGFYAFGVLPTGTSKNGVCAEIMCFASKYLEVAGLATGDYIEVLNIDGDVVSTATESGGTALADLSQYGDGAAGTDEPVPLEGFTEIVVRNSGDVEQASIATGVYPGGEYDLTAGEIVVRIDSVTGPEPFPITGLLQGSTFNELTPGLLNGDGGIGRVIDSDWWTAAPGEDGYYGGGGGGGAELFLAGLAGLGGAGAGSVDTAAPGAGTVNLGGGGGGSGDAATAGGAGGSGMVVVRTSTPKPPGAAIPTSGLIAHHDARMILGLNEGDVLDTWDDESVAGNDLGKVGSPTYHDGDGARNMNGWPCVRTFNSSYLRYASAIQSGMTEGEIIVVMANDVDGGAIDGIWRFSAYQEAYHPWVDGRLLESWGTTSRRSITSPTRPPYLTSPHLYHVRSAAAEYTVRLNGADVFSDAGGSLIFTNDVPNIGMSKGGQDHAYDGNWGHILIYNRLLTPTERTNLENYMNWYWSL